MLKDHQTVRGVRTAMLAAVASTAIASATHAAVIAKADNTNNMNGGGSWAAGVAPTSADYASWDSTVTAAQTVNTGGNLTWGGIQIVNPGGPITLGNHTAAGNPVPSTVTLTYLVATGPIIDMANATQDLTINYSFFRLGPNATATQSIVIAADRTLTLNGSMSVQGGTHTVQYTGAGNFVANGSLANGSAGLSFQQSNGNVTLNGANSFGGGSGNYILSGGILTVGNDAALNGTRVDFSGGTLRSGVAAGVNLQAGARLINSGAFTIDGPNPLSFQGGISLANGNRTLTNNITSPAGLTLNAVTLTNNSTSRTLTIDGSGLTTINGAIANGSTATASGLTKFGAGTLVLNSTANTYGGTTTVNNGTLAGVGNIPAALDILGGTLAPGNATTPVTTLNSGAFNLAAGAFAPDLTASAADALNVTGSVTLAGQLLPTLAFAPAGGESFFVLLNDDVDAITGAFSNVSPTNTLDLAFASQTYTFNVSYTGDSATGALTGGNDLVLTAATTAIPEPAAVSLLAVPALALLSRRRR